MTKLEPRTTTIELPLLDLRDDSGTEISVGQGFMQLALKSPAMRGLRLLIHGMRAVGGDAAKKSMHKPMAIDYLLTSIAEQYDKRQNEKKEHTSLKTRKV